MDSLTTCGSKSDRHDPRCRGVSARSKETAWKKRGEEAVHLPTDRVAVADGSLAPSECDGVSDMEKPGCGVKEVKKAIQQAAEHHDDDTQCDAISDTHEPACGVQRVDKAWTDRHVGGDVDATCDGLSVIDKRGCDVDRRATLIQQGLNARPETQTSSADPQYAAKQDTTESSQSARKRRSRRDEPPRETQDEFIRRWLRGGERPRPFGRRDVPSELVRNRRAGKSVRARNFIKRQNAPGRLVGPPTSRFTKRQLDSAKRNTTSERPNAGNTAPVGPLAFTQGTDSDSAPSPNSVLSFETESRHSRRRTSARTRGLATRSVRSAAMSGDRSFSGGHGSQVSEPDEMESHAPYRSGRDHAWDKRSHDTYSFRGCGRRRRWQFWKRGAVMEEDAVTIRSGLTSHGDLLEHDASGRPCAQDGSPTKRDRE